MQNQDLQNLYNRIYKTGRMEFFSFPGIDEAKAIIDMLPSWANRSVLEIGCGEGDLAHMIALLGARYVDAVDYSVNAINTARQKHKHDSLFFYYENFKDLTDDKYDVVVMQGVLEHIDNPYVTLIDILNKHVDRHGYLITSSPNFNNVRGIVWQTVQLFFNIKMSMADLCEISPLEMENVANECGYHLSYKGIDYTWGCGDRTIRDFNKRFKSDIFKKKYKDATGHTLTDEIIEKFLEWLKEVIMLIPTNDFTGANLVYKFRKQNRKVSTHLNTKSIPI